jgi:hypothetical protein
MRKVSVAGDMCCCSLSLNPPPRSPGPFPSVALSAHRRMQLFSAECSYHSRPVAAQSALPLGAREALALVTTCDADVGNNRRSGAQLVLAECGRDGQGVNKTKARAGAQARGAASCTPTSVARCIGGGAILPAACQGASISAQSLWWQPCWEVCCEARKTDQAMVVAAGHLRLGKVL